MGLTQSEHRFASTVVSHHHIDLFLASACTIPLVMLFIATVAAPPLIGTGRGPQEWVCNPDIIASAPLLAWFTNKFFFMSLSLFALWTSSTAESFKPLLRLHSPNLRKIIDRPRGSLKHQLRLRAIMKCNLRGSVVEIEFNFSMTHICAVI
ncbi:putative pentatricopeptide repeat-containing protein [Corchorus olitorius]|uniref:Pentatricopeptide repeat-containing protein n=1 Tax=Corchorus olitorius TaxID=93759 RepID=A0A1R3HMQ6_9ROSI|nr:putative pentatricopeptide repeat-containing protein [Corchorus olitorius]